jgi:nicotinate-nucleotide adenylyltransferase
VGSSLRIGIYGGSFDPVHIGHLALAEEARYSLGLDIVYVVPTARQPLKLAAQGASPEQRLAMLQLACADNPHLIVSAIEQHRPPPSYTADTLAAFAAEHGPTADLWFVLGADAARDLPRWHRAEAIIGLARLAIVGRPGYSLDLDALEAQLPGLRARSLRIDGPQLEIASSELRARIAAGRPVRYQIPEPARAYIAANGLYREAADGDA